jgi:hypothetical protein
MTTIIRFAKLGSSEIKFSTEVETAEEKAASAANNVELCQRTDVTINGTHIGWIHPTRIDYFINDMNVFLMKHLMRF